MGAGRMSQCDACNKPVAWYRNDKTGKAALVDLEPYDDGNVTVDFEAGTYHVMTKAEREAADGADVLPMFRDGSERRFKLHFATCPKADHFRRCRKCRHTPCRCAGTVGG